MTPDLTYTSDDYLRPPVPARAAQTTESNGILPVRANSAGPTNEFEMLPRYTSDSSRPTTADGTESASSEDQLLGSPTKKASNLPPLQKQQGVDCNGADHNGVMSSPTKLPPIDSQGGVQNGGQQRNRAQTFSGSEMHREGSSKSSRRSSASDSPSLPSHHHSNNSQQQHQQTNVRYNCHHLTAPQT